MPSPHHRDPNEIPSALPADYTRVHNYADWEGAHPGVPPPGTYLNADFDAVEQSIAETQDRAALIQRDDGNLQNGIVTLDSLDPALAADLAALVSNEVADLIVALDAQVADAAASALAAATAETNAELAETNAEAAQTAAEAAQTAAEAAQTAAELAETNAEAVLTAISNFSAVRADDSAGTTICDHATWVDVVFGDEDLDTAGEYNPATGVFTAANNGVYFVSAIVSAVPPTTVNTANAYFYTRIVHPGADVYGVIDVVETTGVRTRVSSSVSAVIALTAGQTIKVQAEFVAAALQYVTISAGLSSLSIHRVK